MAQKTTNVLLVEDDKIAAALIIANLTAAPDRHFEIVTCMSLAEVGPLLQNDSFQIVLLDLNLPDSQGAETVRRIAAKARAIPIVVLTGSQDDLVGPECIAAGAQDFLAKSELASARLVSMIDFAMVRHVRVAEVERVALTDELTGLLNRRAILGELDVAAARARRGMGGFALAMIDLDGFKQVNDSYGHAAGDEVLVEVAARLQALCRTNDHSGRLGGDEFVLILDGAEHEPQANIVIGRHLEALRRPIFVQTQDGPRRAEVTASFGVALCPEHATTVEELTEIADRAMYHVKNHAKNDFLIGPPGAETVAARARESQAAKEDLEQARREAMLAPLRVEFIARLDDRVAALEAFVHVYDADQADSDVWVSTRRHAHSLAGIASVFGFEALGAHAASLEEIMQGDLVPARPEVAARAAMLVATCREVIAAKD